MTHFVRALGASRSGNAEAAKAITTKLPELRDKLREAKDTYRSKHVAIQYQIASAWLLNGVNTQPKGNLDSVILTSAPKAHCSE